MLNVGCGPQRENALHATFLGRGWSEIRLDIDPSVAPDIIGDIVDMREAVISESVDALWSSHNIEHLYAHEAPKALAEFGRVLRADGFALITCPDLRAIAKLISAGRFGETIYELRPAPSASPTCCSAMRNRSLRVIRAWPTAPAIRSTRSGKC